MINFPNIIRFLLASVWQGAKAIAEILKKNSGLRVLELNNNMIDYSVCSLSLSIYVCVCVGGAGVRVGWVPVNQP